MSATQTERFRAEYRRNIESWYRPGVHVLAIYAVGIAALTWFIAQLRAPLTWYEWAVVPMVFVASNITEWAMHRYVMHRPRNNAIARSIYKRHTLNHHEFFTQENYTIDVVRDYRIVFFPPYTEVVAIVLTIPGALVLGAALGANAGWLTLCTTTALYLVYEAFHFCCHVRDNWFLRHCPLINTIRRHHASHHDQRIMTNLNMNLTFPIADWLFGTSDLDRGLLGTLFNGYSTKFLRRDLAQARKTTISRSAAIGGA